jgi:hypothetical protein
MYCTTCLPSYSHMMVVSEHFFLFPSHFFNNYGHLSHSCGFLLSIIAGESNWFFESEFSKYTMSHIIRNEFSYGTGVITFMYHG